MDLFQKNQDIHIANISAVLLKLKGIFNDYTEESIDENKYCIEDMTQDGLVNKAKACILKRSQSDKS